jgi:alpha-galactosidase
VLVASKRRLHVRDAFLANLNGSGRDSRTHRFIGAKWSRRCTVATSSRWSSILLALISLVWACGAALPALSAPGAGPKTLAATPPMGWNDWAHYQCSYTAETIIENAKALVSTGLAARGYNTVTIDDCWMQKTRDARGNLRADPKRFQDGMKPVARVIHSLGLKFGIYEDAGYATCGGFAGSGQPEGRGKDHFLDDARLFASWGVDYLKLDGCNLYVPPGMRKDAAYQKAYAAESAALKSTGHPIIFSESAPAYFQGTPEWYDVLTWARHYGQLWREGADIANYYANRPLHPPFRTRFDSVLWNYAYNLPLGRFQKPGNWNDADFIVGGDIGLSLAESRSQLALWSMMSAPLILSSDIGTLSHQALEVLGNRAVIAVDQDPLGRMATLVRRTAVIDVLFKPLSTGDGVVAILNRSDAPAHVDVPLADLGFPAGSGCRSELQNLWTGVRQTARSSFQDEIAPHDTLIWRIRPSAVCGRPSRAGVIVVTSASTDRGSIEGYSRCLTDSGRVQTCNGASGERWTITAESALRSSGDRCLAVLKHKPVMQACRATNAQRWRYTLVGNLISSDDGQCLSVVGTDSTAQNIEVQSCGHNQPNQIWSLPN